MMHRDMEQSLSPLSMMKDESNSSPTQTISMINTTIEENGSDIEGDSTSDPGILVINEDIDSDHDRRTCWMCCSDALSKKGSTTFWFFAVVTVLIIAAGTLIAVVFQVSRSSTSMNIQQPPSSSSTNNIQHTETYYQERYERFFQEMIITFGDDEESSLSILLTKPDTPQYQAFHWMVYEDTTIVSYHSAADTVLTTALVQRYTIMVLYYACGGEAWQIGSTSSSGSSAAATSIATMGHIDTCEWGRVLNDYNFIVCDTGTKEIVALQLDQKRLIGQLPKELFALSSLVTLDLSYNFLKGTIPSKMFSQMLQLGTTTKNTQFLDFP